MWREPSDTFFLKAFLETETAKKGSESSQRDRTEVNKGESRERKKGKRGKLKDTRLSHSEFRQARRQGE